MTGLSFGTRTRPGAGARARRRGGGPAHRIAAVAATAAGALAMGLPGAVSAAGAGPHPDRPKRVTVSTGGASVRADIGSNCLRDPAQPEEPTGVCEDKVGDPGTRRVLPICPRRRVIVTTGADASRVFAVLSTAGGLRPLASRRARAVGQSLRRWRFRLPRRLRGARLLEVYVDYPAYGSAPFAVSVAQAPRCR